MMKHSRPLSKSAINISNAHLKLPRVSSSAEIEQKGNPDADDCRETRSSVRDSATLTDLCYRENENDSEVHLISLLEEQIPRYTLRADTLTNFAGYENEDWGIRTPCASTEAFDHELSTDLMEETFKYFILGATRLSHMTMTYKDSRALTLLLEEKERDLEIASEIGKILTQRVRRLEKLNEKLTKETEKAKAQVTDLQKQLTLRDSLLRVYVKDFDSDSEPEDTENLVSAHSSLKLTSVNVEAIRVKVKRLQADNEKLASTAERLDREAEDSQDREDHLVTDCIQHLMDMNYSVQYLRAEVDANADVIGRQREQLASQTEQIRTLEAKAKKVGDELKRAARKLSDSEEQKQTALSEAEEWRDRYIECLDLLRSANEEMKLLRKAQKPTSVIQRNYSTSSLVVSPFLPAASLASELHDSQKKDLLNHLGYSTSETRLNSRRVMEVAKAVSRISSRRCLVTSSDQVFTCRESSAGDDESMDAEAMSDRDSLQSQYGSSGPTSVDLSDSELNDDSRSEWNQTQRSLVDFNQSLGQPGIPGSNDLEVALMRFNSPSLSSGENLTQPVSISPIAPKRGSLSSSNTQELLPPSMDFARSRPSSVSSGSEPLTFAIVKPTIPEKLQIVKPLEGSMTLNQWKALAEPHLQGILETRPGVQTRGQPVVRLFEDEEYNLSDLEEDTDDTPLSLPPSDLRSLDVFSGAQGSNYSPVSGYSSASSRSASHPFQTVNLNFGRKKTYSSADNSTRSIPDIVVDEEPRTLPEIVTSGKAPSNVTPVPKPVSSCSVM